MGPHWASNTTSSGAVSGLLPPTLPAINQSKAQLLESLSTQKQQRQSRRQNNVLVHRPQKQAVRTLLVDNYDSYTYNLFQLLAEINGAVPNVIRNDELTWRELAQQLALGRFDNIVISPGPGTPVQAIDAGICNLLLEEAESIPILGVCFGMQALAHVHGGKVIPAPEPIHGRLSELRHSGHPLFAGIPSGHGGGFEVVRYHSLAVDEQTLPGCLEPIAWTTGAHHAVDLQGENTQRAMPGLMQEDLGSPGLLMGLAHTDRPHFGVQFHPESVATRSGVTVLQNFRRATCNHRAARGRAHGMRSATAAEPPPAFRRARPEEPAANLDVRWRVFPGAAEELGGSEAIFWRLYGSHGTSDTFWLDSASQEGQRFSYFGGRGGPLWERISFKLANPRQQPESANEQKNGGLAPGKVTIENAAGETHSVETHFLEFLERRLSSLWCSTSGNAAGLPFDFTGGFVGYLGYELKAECGAPGTHISQHPDAAMFLTDRMVAVDHKTNDIYLVALYMPSKASSVQAADAWIEGTVAHLFSSRPQRSSKSDAAELEDQNFQRARDIKASTSSHIGLSQERGELDGWEERLSADGLLEARRSKSGYTADIARCLQALRAGESYELCMTTQLRHNGRVDPWRLYTELRASNPSAHAAWLSFGDGMPTVCCSSPERFLRGNAEGVVEARPIKGTAARFEDPALDAQQKAALQHCEKSRAENLMIVDLLRNDLGRFCQIGSVHVSKLMEVETYATVHNLVSTVRGVRREDQSIIDCIRAAFPGGSMTGAPKMRSMQILDRLENGPRGVYSGSLGYIGLNDTFDLNIVIRTAVVTDDEVTIGAGGAIVLQSDTENEYEEMRLKARALLRAISRCSAAEP